MADNFYLSLSEMERLLGNMVNPSQDIMTARREFLNSDDNINLTGLEAALLYRERSGISSSISSFFPVAADEEKNTVIEGKPINERLMFTSKNSALLAA